VPAWYPVNDTKAIAVQYPGSKVGQADAALGLGLNADTPLTLICYSAAAESCLLFAKSHIQRGGRVAGILLLGPTFTGADEPDGADIGYAGWVGYMDWLLEKGVDIINFDDMDRNPFDFNPATVGFYDEPAGASGSYVLVIGFYEHFDGEANPLNGTNTDSGLRRSLLRKLEVLNAENPPITKRR